MAKFKIWMVALTLIMGVSLTSCFDSGDSESTFDGGGFVRVKGSILSYHFEDTQGNKYYPTSASLSQMETNYGFKISESNFCLIYYKNVETEETAAKATEKTINLVSAQAFDGPSPLVVEDVEQMATVAPEKEPVVTAAATDATGNQIKPSLYDLETLVMCLSWKLSANSVEAFNKHTLNLVCVRDEIKEDDTELVLYLRHDIGEDKAGGAYYYTNWYGYNIRSAVNSFYLKTGTNPTKLIIKAKESTNSSELPENYTEYSVDYKIAN